MTESALKEEDIVNEDLKKEVELDSELKNILVGYVGHKHQPENNEVTVEMIVETMATEFPEFLMAVAEENFIRGYQQAFDDIEKFQKEQEDNKDDEKSD